MLIYDTHIVNIEQKLNAISNKYLTILEIWSVYTKPYLKLGSGDPINAHKHNTIKPIKKNTDLKSTLGWVLQLESLVAAEQLYENFLEQCNRLK